MCPHPYMHVCMHGHAYLPSELCAGFGRMPYFLETSVAFEIFRRSPTHPPTHTHTHTHTHTRTHMYTHTHTLSCMHAFGVLNNFVHFDRCGWCHLGFLTPFFFPIPLRSSVLELEGCIVIVLGRPKCMPLFSKIVPFC